jgi:DNA-binding NtrC family response regulator
MTDAGYRVHLAMNGTQIIRYASHHLLNILIVDPDLPDSDSLSLLKNLRDHLPHLPVIIHTFISDYAEHSDIFDTAVWVEKEESSVERLKEVVAKLLLSADIKKETA